MSIELLTLLMVGGIVVLLAMGVPLAFVTGTVAMVMAYALFGPQSLALIASRTYTLMSEFVLVAVPMFIFMASILERSGVARDLFRAMHVWAGGLRGGLAIQTMGAGVLMAAMTGIIGGEIVLLGLIALPQMLRRRYDRKLAIGTICAGGSLGTMIPPSIVLIVYGLTANVPIGNLFIATCRSRSPSGSSAAFTAASPRSARLRAWAPPGRSSRRPCGASSPGRRSGSRCIRP
jgi:TRAP-type mannitol/chloroaromatic compound transport system permease large subunit